MEKQTEQIVQKPRRVEELKNFPFESFADFKKAMIEGIINIGVDRGIALQWIENGIYSPRWQRTQVLFLSYLTFIIPISLIIYAVVTETWFLLLTLPILLISFFIFHPGYAVLLGPIRSGFIALVFVGLGWSLIKGTGWLIVFTSSLAALWYVQHTIYSKVGGALISAATEHEDLLCLLWKSRALNIKFYNGDSYWVDWKIEDGKNIHYNDKK